MKVLDIPFEDVQAGDMASHVSKALDSRPVSKIYPESRLFRVEFPGGLESEFLLAENYTFKRIVLDDQ